MEVFVGPTFGIEVSSSSSAAAAGVYVSSQDKNASPPCIFLKENEIEGGGSLIGAPVDDSSGSSSSIGAPDDSEDEGEEVSSSILSKSGLSSLDSLEESLPIKRGLSNHFTGKSKSFANLSDVLMNSSSNVVTVKDLEKPENPFNKRRRLILANKWCKKSFYSWSNPKSMPLLTLNEEQHDDDEHQKDEDEEEEESQVSPSSSSSEHELLRNQPRFSKLQEKNFKKSFKSHSCFSLSDLQHQQEFE